MPAALWPRRNNTAPKERKKEIKRLDLLSEGSLAASFTPTRSCFQTDHGFLPPPSPRPQISSCLSYISAASYFYLPCNEKGHTHRLEESKGLPMPRARPSLDVCVQTCRDPQLSVPARASTGAGRRLSSSASPWCSRRHRRQAGRAQLCFPCVFLPKMSPPQHLGFANAKAFHRWRMQGHCGRWGLWGIPCWWSWGRCGQLGTQALHGVRV